MSRFARAPHRPVPRLMPLVGLLGAALALSGCADSASPGPSPTASASASTSTGAAPTAEQTAWAGDVCTSTSTLKSDLQGLVTAATSGGNDVSGALSAQMTVVTQSAAALATTLKDVPAGSEDDPSLAAVRQSADDLDTSIGALESSVAAVDGATGTALVVAIAAVATAAGDSLAALAATVEAIAAAAGDARSSIGQAFDAAPECNALTN